MLAWKWNCYCYLKQLASKLNWSDFLLPSFFRRPNFFFLHQTHNFLLTFHWRQEITAFDWLCSLRVNFCFIWGNMRFKSTGRVTPFKNMSLSRFYLFIHRCGRRTRSTWIVDDSFKSWNVVNAYRFIWIKFQSRGTAAQNTTQLKAYCFICLDDNFGETKAKRGLNIKSREKKQNLELYRNTKKKNLIQKKGNNQTGNIRI